MPINDHYVDDTDYGWAMRNPGIVGGFCLVLGIAVGIAANQFWLQQDLVKQLAQVEKEVKATHHPLNQLTGFNDATQRTNSLLARLEDQSSKLYKAGQTIQRSDRLHDEIARLSAKLNTVDATAAKLSNMQSDLDKATLKLTAAQKRVDELESLAARLGRSGVDIYKAKDALSSMELVQQQLINQQCLMPELTATVDNHWKLQNAICDLAAQSDATDRAIDSLAHNQNRVQQLAIDTEQSNLVLAQVQSILDNQKSMDLQVQKLADTLDAATELSYEAIRLNTRIKDVRKETTSATKNMDELAWLVNFLNSQEEKISKAQENLHKIDQIEDQVVRLDDCVPALVENVDLVTGLNKTMVAVLGSSSDLRSQLAEIVLMQPAVEQLATQFRQITAPSEGSKLVDARDRAKEMIESSQPELKIPMYISRAK
ncbi:MULTISPECIES: hypothetical protein [Pirellulaceae]|nr:MULTISPECIES: hypothetical protein [Pirellulaceae]